MSTLSASSNQNDDSTSKAESGRKNSANDLPMILASGLPWNISKADVAIFFSDVNIVGGIDGIEIKRRNVNGPNEAKFSVRPKDMRKALARNNLLFGSRTIYGI